MRHNFSSLKFLAIALAVAFGWSLIPGKLACAAAPPPYQLTLVEDLNLGSASGLSSSGLKPFAVLNNQLYFGATNGATGFELYKYDGQHVSLAADIYTGSSDSSPIDLTLYQDKLFFSARNSSGIQLYSFNGTTAQPVQGYTAEPTGLTVLNNALLYSVQNTAPNNGGVGLNKFNGTTAQYFANIGQGNNFIVNDTAVFQNRLLFEGFAPGTGLELLQTDGNTVSLVADLNPGTGNGAPGSFAVYNGNLYFGASSGGTVGSKLYKYDGTTVSAIASFDTTGGPTSLTVFNGQLYFEAFKFSTRSEVYKYDGSTVSLAAEVSPGIPTSSPHDLTVFNGELFFAAFNEATGYELYKLDGSSASLVADVRAGSQGSDLNDFFVFQNSLYFKADDGAHGTELYRLSVVPEPSCAVLTLIWIFVAAIKRRR